MGWHRMGRASVSLALTVGALALLAPGTATQGAGLPGPGDDVRSVDLGASDGTERKVTTNVRGAHEHIWSPDGARLAFVGMDGGLFVTDTSGGRGRRLVRRDAASPDWSPDGRTIVFQRGRDRRGEIWSVDVRTGRLTRLTRPYRTLARCRRIRPLSRDVGRRFPACSFGSHDPVWSPDGRWIAFLRHENEPGPNMELEDTDLWLMRSDGADKHRAVTGEDAFHELPGHTSPDGHLQDPPVWSRDGRSIALRDAHCACLVLVDVATGTPRRLRSTAIEWPERVLDRGPHRTLPQASADPSAHAMEVE